LIQAAFDNLDRIRRLWAARNVMAKQIDHRDDHFITPNSVSSASSVGLGSHSTGATMAACAVRSL
jgi:hypothetical protein